jgi:ATP-dependent Clp protease protease subunit
MSAEEAEEYGLVDKVLNPKNLEGLKSIQPNGEPGGETEDDTDDE